MPYRESTATPHDHAVNFYDDDAELVAAVASFLVAGITRGQRSVVVATPDRRALLDTSLALQGHDPEGARSSGLLRTLDAEETLATFMRDGVPDPGCFRSSIGGLIDAAAENGLPVRAFGEMVALLWQQDNVSGAVALETLWNALAVDRDFSLLCAYPASTVGGTSLIHLQRVCELHSSVVAPRSYASGSARLSATSAAAARSSHTFVCVPGAVPAVRRFVAQVLADWDETDLVADATLVASELATNAVCHARSPFRLTLDRAGSALRVTVEDVDVDQPTLHHPTDDATDGRGVFIVDGVCRAWGSDPLPHGKAVWAELTPLGRRAASSIG